MPPEAKKLGVLLIEAGLITPAQLQETLRHQRISGGRLGSTLVAQGIINEDSLMDFLAKQTGVPRLDVKQLEVPAGILKRIPRRLAEQMTILPVGLKEPRSLVLAMADPLDLNAVDSARFASGMSIEPVVASHKALRQAIADNYGRLEGAVQPLAIDFNPLPAPTEQSARVLNNPFLSPPPTPIPVPVPVPVDLSTPFHLCPETKAPPPPRPRARPAPDAIRHHPLPLGHGRPGADPRILRNPCPGVRVDPHAPAPGHHRPG